MKIKINNLKFEFPACKLFNNLNLELVSDTRPIVILGPSGSGKTTFLKLLASLIKPYSGKIEFVNEDKILSELPKIGFMFQEARLIPWFNVLENIILPIKKELSDIDATARANNYLSMVKLGEKAFSYPSELSGGQAQRISMARAFAWLAPFLFMDEPFQSMDLSLKLSLMNATLSYVEKVKCLLLLVSHDPREAIYLGSRIIIFGKEEEGIVYDEYINLSVEERNFYSPVARELEKEIGKFLNV